MRDQSGLRTVDRGSTDVIDLSVIIVNWNGAAVLEPCVRSVLGRRGALSLELIVVDNASTDGSVDALAGHGHDIQVIRNNENRGFARANNQALRIARGRRLLLLNSDTLVLDDVLERSVQYLDEHEDVGALGCRVLNPDRTLQPTCFRFPSLLNLFLWGTGLSALGGPFFGRQSFDGWARDSERDVDVVTGCYLMVRREILDEVGGLDERFFFFAEETDWCDRIARAGWRVRFAPIGSILHIGGFSTERLDHERDLLLVTAYMQLHRKRHGRAAGWAAGALLWGYWATRWLAFSLRLLVKPTDALRARRDSYWRVLRGFGDARRRAVNHTAHGDP